MLTSVPCAPINQLKAIKSICKAPKNLKIIVLGGFSENDVSSGWIGCLNIYNQSFPSDGLINLSRCSKSGDIFSLAPDVGQMYGDVTVYKNIMPSSGNPFFLCLISVNSSQNYYTIQIATKSKTQTLLRSCCTTYSGNV